MAAITLIQQLRQRNDQRERDVFALEEQRRQEDFQQRERARQEVLRKQEQDNQNAITLWEKTPDANLNDVLTAVPGVDTQGRAMLKLLDSQRKAAKKAQEATGEGGTLSTIGELIKAGGPLAQRPPGINSSINDQVAALQMQLQDQPDLLTQALTRLGSMQSLTDAETISAQRERERALRDALAERERTQRQDARVSLDLLPATAAANRRETSLDALAARRTAFQDLDMQREEKLFQSRVAASAAELYASALPEEVVGHRGRRVQRTSIESTIEKIRRDPVLKKDAQRAFSLIADSIRLNKDTLMEDSATRAEYRVTGINVGTDLLNSVNENKAFMDDRFASLGMGAAPIYRESGKPGAASSNRIRVESVNRVVGMVAQMEAAAHEFAAELQRTGDPASLLTQPIESLKETTGAGRALYELYDTISTLATLSVGTAEGGKQVSDFEQQMYRGLKQRIASMTVQDVASLSPQGRARIFAIRKFAEEKLYAMTPMDRRWMAKRLDEAYRRQVDQSVDELHAGLMEWGAGGRTQNPTDDLMVGGNAYYNEALQSLGSEQ
jgi:hypothetical protein